MRVLFVIYLFTILPILIYGNSARKAGIVGKGQSAYTMNIIEDMVIYTYPLLKATHTVKETEKLISNAICGNSTTKKDIKNGYKYVYIYAGDKSETMVAVVSECK